MPINTKQFANISSRSDLDIAMLDEPPLGHLQAIILKTLADLGDEACGYKVVEKLIRKTRVSIDASQIYASIRKFRTRRFVSRPIKRKSGEGGPPLKIYRITPAGRTALTVTAEHYRAVLSYLEELHED